MAARKKKRFPEGSVCKPCWELKYCPYGYLVEQFPFANEKPINHQEIRKGYDIALAELTSGNLSTEEQVWDAIDRMLHLNPQNWKEIEDYDPQEVNCLVWGHMCPVFLAQSGATETIEGRSEGRRISREVMLKVVRRDAQRCQICGKWVPDNEIEFDHIIPYSRGGTTSVENIRVLCKSCNRARGNSMDEFLEPRRPE